jgi:hypothetical protein
MNSAATERLRQFRPPGPVAARFLSDKVTKVRGLLGPVAGGKTVTCIFDTLINATEMPICLDGKIHHRHVIVGSTYGQIERNLYPTWFHWLPKHGDTFVEAEWEGGGGRFGRHMVYFQALRSGRRIPVELEVLFAAVGEQSVEAFVRGFEPTSAHFYEVDQLPPNIITNMVGRFGRYPNAQMLGRQPDYRTYAVADYNAPDIDNWTVKAFDEEATPGYKLYRQPSALSPNAENLANLKPGYYQELAILNATNPRWVKRFLEVKYGPSDAGDPVFPEYSDDLHLSMAPLSAVPGRGIYLGFDQGLRHPAMVVLQQLSSGQFVVLGECVPGRMNARRFAELCRQLIADIAPGQPVLGAWSDPAGFDGADTEAGDLAWSEIVAVTLDIVLAPAPSNEPDVRLTAVRDELTFLVDPPHVAGLVLSRGACPMLRKGFVSHYFYQRRAIDAQQVRLPEKNLHANPHDALQYVLLGIKGRYGVIQGKRPARGSVRGQRTVDDDCIVASAPVMI